ncbi:hypothetical protein MMC25_002467 [Agyrium rufum]|nr:hypothetical protein [Agyrium rufum]
MAAEYNRRARAQGFSEEEMFAMQSNLLNRDESASNPVTKGEEWYNFDVAIVCLGFHHLEDPELAVEQLVQRLRPGTGSLVVLDFLDAHEGMGFNEVIEDMKKESGSSGDQGHEHGHGHSHNHKRSHEHGHQHNHGQDGGDGTNGKSDPVAQTVALHGFSIDRIQEIYRKAGCKDVEVALVDDPIQFEGQFGGRKIKAFISRGYRAPSSI